MKNKTLFEINTEYRDILAEMEAFAELHDGDITEFPLLDHLAKIDGDLSEKVLNIAALIKELGAEAKAIDELAKGLAARSSAKKSRAERLKRYLADNIPMDAVFEDSRAKVAWQGNGGARPAELMPDVRPEDLPEWARRVVVTPDLTGIREALEATLAETEGAQPPEITGEPLELKDESGRVLAIVKPRGKSLRIK